MKILALALLLALAASPHPAIADAPADRLAEAYRRLQKGDYQGAFEAYGKLEKADPLAAAIGASRALESRGDWKRAADGLEAAVKKTPDRALLWARLAQLQFEHGRLEEAGASVAAALKLVDEQPLARLVQARLFQATGRLQEADDGYRWFVRYYNRVHPKDTETQLLVAEGSGEYARWHSVPEIFDFVINDLCPDVLKTDSLSWQTSFISGSLLLEKYNRVQALPDFQQALAVNPRAAEVHAALGRAALQQSNLTEAETRADHALQINPALIAALWIKADLELNAGDTDGALKVLKGALEVNPRDERTLARVAACDLLEDGPPAEAELRDLLDHLDHPDQIAAKPASRFAQLVVELARINPHPGVFLNQLGETLEWQRQFDLAERFYTQALASMPQLYQPKTNLGILYMRIGKNAQARPILDQAFQADPYDARLSNMQKVLEVLDGYEAITTAHFVIRVDSTADDVLGHYMARYLEEQYPVLVKEFGFEPQAPTQFEIYSNAKGTPAQQWFSSRMLGMPWIQTVGASTGMIVALASPTAGQRPFNWARVVRHEFTHIITLQQTRFNIPHWYTEALAVMNEGYPRPAIWDQLLAARLAQGDVMNLGNINFGFIRPRNQGDWFMAYCQSLLYAQYMIAKYGAQSIIKLLDAYRNRLTTEQAIPKVFGVDQAAFEKGYREYLNGVVAEVRRDSTAAAAHAAADTANGAQQRTALEKLTQTDSEDPEPREKLTRMAFDQKAWADVVRWGRLALEVDVMDVETHRMLGAAYGALGQHAPAIDELGVALEIKPDDADLGVALAREEIAAGKKESARKRLDGILARHPDHAAARELRAGLK